MFINKLIIFTGMPIISASLNQKLLKEMGAMQREVGFSGRSEIIRAGLRLLITEQREKAKLKGKVDGVLLIIHEDKYSQEVSNIRHHYSDIIQTQVHNHLENNKCLEIFVLKGDATVVKKVSDEFQTNRKIDFVKLIVS